MTLNRRLTVDLRPQDWPREPEYRDHQVLADGLLQMVLNEQLSAEDMNMTLQYIRRRLPGQNQLDEALLRQVRMVYGIEEQRNE